MSAPVEQQHHRPETRAVVGGAHPGIRWQCECGFRPDPGQSPREQRKAVVQHAYVAGSGTPATNHADDIPPAPLTDLYVLLENEIRRVRRLREKFDTSCDELEASLERTARCLERTARMRRATDPGAANQQVSGE